MNALFEDRSAHCFYSLSISSSMFPSYMSAFDCLNWKKIPVLLVC